MIDILLKKLILWGGAAAITLALAAAPGEAYAQEDGKSKYEKVQKEKIKRNNKRIKNRGRAQSNKRQLRMLQYQTGSRQGDRPYDGRLNRSVRKRIPSASTPAVYAQPDPYSFRSGSRKRRNIYSNDALIATPRPPAKAWDKGRSKRITPASQPPPNINIYAQPNPYSFRKKRSERDRISRTQGSLGTSPRSPERAARTAPSKYDNRSVPRINVHPQANPYSFRKKRSERDRISRTQSTFGTSPRSPERASRSAPPKFNNRSSVPNFNVYAQPSPYSFRKKRTEDARMSDNQSSFGTDPRDPDRPAKKRRVKVSSASGRYVVTRRAKPYKLRDRKKWEETYTGGFYGRRSNVRPKNTQRVSVSGAGDPYSGRGRLGDKAYGGEITGGYKSAPRNTQKAWKGDIAGSKIRSVSADRGRINVFPGVDPYSNRKDKGDAGRISRNQDFYGSSPKSTERAAARRKVKINSATRGYIVNRKAKPYKIRDQKKWEETYTGGFYGRRPGVTPKNPQRVSSMLAPDTYAKRGKLGDKPYKGMTGGFVTDPKQSERAWKGDIAGFKLRTNEPRNTQRDGGRIAKANTASRAMNRNNEGEAIRSFIPGNTALKTTTFKGDRDMFEVHPGFYGDYLNFQGTVKARRPDKGGGSVARADWNNKGERLPQRYIDKDSRIAGSFHGSLKASKPLKGGGSVSNGAWNNDGQSLPKKFGDKNSRVMGSFGGTLKAYKPEKGGGSISRKRGEGWNNDGYALEKKHSAGSWSNHRGKIEQKGHYTRNKSANENALKVREPDHNYFAAGNFTGNIKRSSRKIDGDTHTNTKFYSSKDEGNAVEEKKKFISFKMLWNRWFGKETPDPPKERKPRYDKGEKGLWNE